MTITDRQGLLRDILTNPSDNIPRLIYADWLEEYGNEYDVARAEFIRLQISSSELQKIPGLQGLLYKEDELLLKYKFIWDLDCWPLNFAAWDKAIRAEWSRGFISKILLNLRDFLHSDVAETLFSCHPIEQVTLIDIVPRREIRQGLSLYHRLKIEMCTDREDIPTVLDKLLPKTYNSFSGWRFFPSEKEANEALSTACVKYGRQKAGLPDDT